MQLDGNDVPAEDHNSDFPVDPGRHTVVASAPGHDAGTGYVDLAGQGDRKVVTIPSLVARTIAAPAPQPIAPTTPAETTAG